MNATSAYRPGKKSSFAGGSPRRLGSPALQRPRFPSAISALPLRTRPNPNLRLDPTPSTGSGPSARPATVGPIPLIRLKQGKMKNRRTMKMPLRLAHPATTVIPFPPPSAAWFGTRLAHPPTSSIPIPPPRSAGCRRGPAGLARPSTSTIPFLGSPAQQPPRFPSVSSLLGPHYPFSFSSSGVFRAESAFLRPNPTTVEPSGVASLCRDTSAKLSEPNGSNAPQPCPESAILPIRPNQGKRAIASRRRSQGL